jgi:hypothetical protein
MRIALVTSCANGDELVKEAALNAAFRFCEWQECIVSHYKAGYAETADGRCTEAIIAALEARPEGTSIIWSKLAKLKHWYQRFGAGPLARCRDGLAREGVICFDKKTGRVWLPDN